MKIDIVIVKKSLNKTSKALTVGCGDGSVPKIENKESVMPRVVEYPRASLANAIELASAVHALGGHSTLHTCADKMSKKVGGAFQAQVSAADKFGLIDNQRGQLVCTELFNQYAHAYSPDEEQSLLQRAFLSSGVFATLYERFRGRPVPDEILDRILVREFSVPPQAASRISGYFISGAKLVGLLDADNKLIDIDSGIGNSIVTEESGVGEQRVQSDPIRTQRSRGDEEEMAVAVEPTAFAIQFRGPGLNTTIEILEEDDLLIVDAILRKIRKKLEGTEQC